MDQYSEIERVVWKRSAEDKERWKKKIDSQYFILAKRDSELIGMGSLEKDYIDVLYVHPAFSGMGIAHNIYKELERQAIDTGQVKLETDASYVARPFFERQGFEVVRMNRNNRYGVELINFRMRKGL